MRRYSFPTTISFSVLRLEYHIDGNCYCYGQGPNTRRQREKTARTEERGGGGGKEWEEGEEGKEEEKEMRASWRKKKGREEGKKGKMRTKVRGENAENRKKIKKR